MENSGIDSISNARHGHLPGDLVWKILVHVPTKSLMRFKLVSKLWYSIIRNLDFANNHSLYNACFGGILITGFVNYTKPCCLHRVFYENLNVNNFDNRTKLKYYEHVTLDLRDFTCVTSIVKGLIGLYKDDCFSLCNISTQEIVSLPPTNSSFDYDDVSYHLGFDPVKDVYKVLKFDDNYSFDDSGIKTEIFTVGRDSDLAWRDIDRFPFESGFESLFINGKLYCLPWDITEETESLVAFDLNSERYECIELPIPDLLGKGDATLADIGGSPAIVYLDTSPHEHDIAEIWMMEKDGGGKFEGWTKKTYRWPVDSLVFGGTLPTEEMLIIQSFP